MAARRLTGVNGKAVIKALLRSGFVEERVSGSHHVMRKPDVNASKVIVPVHGAHDLPPGTLRSIAKQTGLSLDEFIALL